MELGCDRLRRRLLTRIGFVAGTLGGGNGWTRLSFETIRHPVGAVGNPESSEGISPLDVLACNVSLPDIEVGDLHRSF